MAPLSKYRTATVGRVSLACGVCAGADPPQAARSNAKSEYLDHWPRNIGPPRSDEVMFSAYGLMPLFGGAHEPSDSRLFRLHHGVALRVQQPELVLRLRDTILGRPVIPKGCF